MVSPAFPKMMSKKQLLVFLSSLPHRNPALFNLIGEL